MDGVELELACPCGYENFERVVVQRKPHGRINKDFVACVGCKAMYFCPVPKPDPPEWRPRHDMKGIGGPEKSPPVVDSAAAFKRDAANAAQDYRKPGRSTRK